MSAQIPSTMLLSDLLKPTGYDCPEELQGKTFDEATAGGDVEVESNHAATIDVSQYTEPVVIEPTEGKDAMAKVTATLSNIPSVPTLTTLNATENKTYTPAAGTAYNSVVVSVPPYATLRAWKLESAIVYTKTATPTTSDKALVPATTGLSEAVIAAVADEHASITIGESTYTRYSDGDVTI